jgi:hypothetical protein
VPIEVDARVDDLRLSAPTSPPPARPHWQQSAQDGEKLGALRVSAHVGGGVFRREKAGGVARTPTAECFEGRESWGRCTHSGSGVFRRERAGGAVRTNGGKSVDRVREAVWGLPGAVTDCTTVDASSVRTCLLCSVPAFLRRP